MQTKRSPTLGRGRQGDQGSCGDRADAGDGHQPAGRLVLSGTAGDLPVEIADPAIQSGQRSSITRNIAAAYSPTGMSRMCLDAKGAAESGQRHRHA